MGRTNIPQEPRIRAELQKEIGSRCPFCTSEDVGHFEIHHIDENNKNHNIENLLLLCKPCHSKFTKKEWDQQEAKEKKLHLLRDINYLLYQSDPNNGFDYLCYNMHVSNGRLTDENGNGSIAHINVIDRYHFKIKLNQNDGRCWEGALTLEKRDYGKLFLTYIGNEEYEFSRRECFLRQLETDSFRESSLFFKPLTDLKDYGNELFRRRIYK